MAYLFDDANSQYLRASSAPVSGPPFTVACWFYLDALDSGEDYAVYIGDQWGTNKHALRVFGQYSYAVNTYSQSESANGAASSSGHGTGIANAWHHACGVWSATNARAAFYDGGSKATNSTDVVPININTLQVSGRVSALYFTGALAEVAVWDAALADAEVAILAKGVSPLAVRPGSLVFYAPLVRGLQEIIGARALTESASAPTVSVHPRVFYPAPLWVGLGTGGEAPVGLPIPVAMHHYRMMRA